MTNGFHHLINMMTSIIYHIKLVRTTSALLCSHLLTLICCKVTTAYGVRLQDCDRSLRSIAADGRCRVKGYPMSTRNSGEAATAAINTVKDDEKSNDTVSHGPDPPAAPATLTGKAPRRNAMKVVLSSAAIQVIKSNKTNSSLLK